MDYVQKEVILTHPDKTAIDSCRALCLLVKNLILKNFDEEENIINCLKEITWEQI